MVLVVPVRDETDELRFALRSFKNIKYDRLILVGHKPSWVKNADHIKIEETNRHENIARCVEAALKKVKGEFIIAEDDHFVMQPTDLPDVDRGPLEDVIGWQMKRRQGEYLEGMQYAQSVAPGKSYELHRPMRFDRDLLQFIFNAFNKGGSFQYRTIYGNYWHLESETVPDFKVRGKEDFTDWPFISTSNRTFKKVRPFLESRFPDPSPHE